MKIFDAAASVPWAIYEPALRTILDIAARTDPNPESLAAWKDKLGTAPIDALASREGERLRPGSRVVLRGRTAVLPIVGPIVRHADLFSEISGATSLARTATEFQAAIADPRVDRVMLAIDSPGGEVTGIGEFAAQLREARRSIEIVAYVEGLGASAAYWIAASASRVVLAPTAMVGSIGVVTTMLDTREREAKAGVRRIEIVSSQSPDKRLDPATDAGRAKIQALVDRIAVEFVGDVAAGRGVEPADVLARFGQGGMVVGSDAVAAGMADSVGTFEDLLAALSADSATTRSIIVAAATPRRESHMEKTTPASPAPAPAPSPAALTLDTLRAQHPDLCATLIAEGRAEGAKAERARIDGLLKIAAVPLPDLAAKFIADGATTRADAAEAFLEHERRIGTVALDQAKAAGKDGPAPAPAAAVPAPAVPAADASLPLEARAKAAWDGDPRLRGEFGDSFERYLAYAKANESGRVRLLSKAG